MERQIFYYIENGKTKKKKDLVAVYLSLEDVYMSNHFFLDSNVYEVYIIGNIVSVKDSYIAVNDIEKIRLLDTEPWRLAVKEFSRNLSKILKKKRLLCDDCILDEPNKNWIVAEYLADIPIPHLDPVDWKLYRFVSYPANCEEIYSIIETEINNTISNYTRTINKSVYDNGVWAFHLICKYMACTIYLKEVNMITDKNIKKIQDIYDVYIKGYYFRRYKGNKLWVSKH